MAIDHRHALDRRLVIGGAVMMMAAPGLAETLTLENGREVPLRVWRAVGKPRALVVFSHGANSRPDKYDRLCAALAAAGYLVAAPLHADSHDHPGGGKIAREAGVPMRLADMHGVAAHMRQPGLAVVAAGHSYGALIAQMLGGAAGLTPAADAVLAWSPPGPFPPAIMAESWQTMARPMLVQTGTADVLPVMAPEWQVHRVSFDRAPGPSVLFVGAGVDHYFGNIVCRPERTVAPQEAQFADAVAVSIAFLALALAGTDFAGLARPAAAGQSWVEIKR